MDVPLALLDESILHREVDAEPWTVHVEVAFSEPLDSVALQQAVRSAVVRHPLAAARLVRDPAARRHRWAIPAGTGDVAVEVTGEPLAEARDEVCSRPFHLDVEAPVRVLLVSDQARSTVIVVASHVATDGRGAFEFLDSIVRALGGERAPSPPSPITGRALEVERGARSPVTRAGHVLRSAGQLRTLADPAIRLAPLRTAERPGYHLHTASLSVADTEALSSRRGEATVNDVLLAALHRTIADWNAGLGGGTGRISVMMPVDLRPRDGDIVLGNLTLMVPVSSSPADRSSDAGLLEAITHQTAAAKTTGAALHLLEAMRIGSGLSVRARQGLQSAVAGSSRLTDTSVLSNLGRLTQTLGGTTAPHVEAVRFSPPCGMPNGLVLGVVTYLDRLQVTTRTRWPLVDEGAAEEFTENFLEAVRTITRTA